MKSNWISRLVGIYPKKKQTKLIGIRVRDRLQFNSNPKAIYAIGDVHGRLDLLRNLESMIANDCAAFEQQTLIIMLGDYLDRGSDSSGVIDHLLNQPSFNAKRICLLGNHEHTMLAFVQNPKDYLSWLQKYGGRETLLSYGLNESEISVSHVKNRRRFAQTLASHIPEDHLEFLKSLPIIALFPNQIFVHAGIRPNVTLQEQSENDLIWIRETFINSSNDFDVQVVHGHTPVEKPFVSSSRVNVDTGAYATNCLTAAKFVDGKFVRFLCT